MKEKAIYIKDIHTITDYELIINILVKIFNCNKYSKKPFMFPCNIIYNINKNNCKVISILQSFRTSNYNIINTFDPSSFIEHYNNTKKYNPKYQIEDIVTIDWGIYAGNRNENARVRAIYWNRALDTYNYEVITEKNSSIWTINESSLSLANLKSIWVLGTYIEALKDYGFLEKGNFYEIVDHSDTKGYKSKYKYVTVKIFNDIDYHLNVNRLNGNPEIFKWHRNIPNKTHTTQ